MGASRICAFAHLTLLSLTACSPRATLPVLAEAVPDAAPGSMAPSSAQAPRAAPSSAPRTCDLAFLATVVDTDRLISVSPGTHDRARIVNVECGANEPDAACATRAEREALNGAAPGATVQGSTIGWTSEESTVVVVVEVDGEVERWTMPRSSSIDERAHALTRQGKRVRVMSFGRPEGATKRSAGVLLDEPTPPGQGVLAVLRFRPNTNAEMPTELRRFQEQAEALRIMVRSVRVMSPEEIGAVVGCD